MPWEVAARPERRRPVGPRGRGTGPRRDDRRPPLLLPAALLLLRVLASASGVGYESVPHQLDGEELDFKRAMEGDGVEGGAFTGRNSSRSR